MISSCSLNLYQQVGEGRMGLEGELAHTSPCSALGVVQSPWDNRDMAVHEETAGGEGSGESPMSAMGMFS